MSSTSYGSDGRQAIDRIADALSAAGRNVKATRSGGHIHLQASCPVHGADRNPSLSVDQYSGEGRARMYCHSCADSVDERELAEAIGLRYDELWDEPAGECVRCHKRTIPLPGTGELIHQRCADIRAGKTVQRTAGRRAGQRCGDLPAGAEAASGPSGSAAGPVDEGLAAAAEGEPVPRRRLLRARGPGGNGPRPQCADRGQVRGRPGRRQHHPGDPEGSAAGASRPHDGQRLGEQAARRLADPVVASPRGCSGDRRRPGGVERRGAQERATADRCGCGGHHEHQRGRELQRAPRRAAARRPRRAGLRPGPGRVAAGDEVRPAARRDRCVDPVRAAGADRTEG